MMYSGTLVLVIGASGSGKGVLMKRAKELHPEIVFPVSATTRAMRPGEVNGEQYYFLTHEEFEEGIKQNIFLEWASIDGGKLYGTPKAEIIPPLEEGKFILDEMEIQGIHQVQQSIPKENLVTVYIDAGSWDTLARRIQGRAPISAEELILREQRYESERAFKTEADYVVENFDGKFKEADASFESLLQKLLGSAK